MTTQTQNKPLAKTGKKELREWLEGDQFRRELTATLPRTMSPERFVRIAFQATYRNPDLLKCSQESFFNCLLQLGAMGLEPDGRRAHLIPFGQECTLIVDYKGIKELVRRNGDVSTMHGDVVGENDEFDLRFGTRGVLDHKPNLQNRGKILGAYSYVKLPDGNEEFDWMNLEEIETVRKRSKSANKGPWVSDWNEMAKKTVFRRHSKQLPLSPETRDALEREADGDSLTEVERFNAAAPAKATVMNGPGRSRTSLPPFPDEPPENPGYTAQPDPPTPTAPGSIGLSEAPQPIAANEQQLSLPNQVRRALAESGYTEPELVALMISLNMAPKKADSLDDCNPERLATALAEWDNVTDRLRGLRKEAQKPV